ncbi:hypothetical protein N0V84_010590 [Fusarium piperis]|uniref:Uncharacterized protein n=1 Tax=Fusarium piperis TaxID=1435070 RepID=A0A9W8TDL0_9HYPO|nr:hypothetical protein N0V84_010590 [Fusarium piperis]
MARRDSLRKSKGGDRPRRSRVSDSNIYFHPPHPQGTHIPSSAPRRASAASYTLPPYHSRPTPSHDPQKQSHAVHPLPHRPTESRQPLNEDEDLRLKALQHPDGTTTGFTVAKTDRPWVNNVCAPLPLPNGGIAFNVDNETSAVAAYNCIKGASGSGKVAGIMFSPPCDINSAVMRDVDWSRLVPPPPAVKEINEADGGFRLSELKSFVPKIPAPPEHMRKR